MLLRRDHPLCEGEITPERFAGFPHLLHSPNGSRNGVLAGPMREAGHPRRLGAVVAHLLAAPEILERTEMVMTLSARLARILAGTHGLALRPVPVPTTHMRLSLVFRRRFEADSGHAWLRRTMPDVARTLGQFAERAVRPGHSRPPRTGAGNFVATAHMLRMTEQIPPRPAAPAGTAAPSPAPAAEERSSVGRPPEPAPGEVGGPKGPEPTRYGDWERKGRVSDF